MKKMAATITILFFFTLFLGAEEDPKYTNQSVARLSYMSGNAFVQRAADVGFEEAVLNMPISEGDRVSTTDGRAEIALGRNNYVRLDENTKTDFVNLPKRENEFTRVRVWAGNIYLSVNSMEKEKSIEIHTTDASFYILDKGLYRVDVRENRETEVFVYRGLIEAAGEEGSVLLKSEQRLEIAGGLLASRPSRFYAVAEDSFDRWSEFRESQVRRTVATKYLPEEMEEFEYELAEYGDWVYLRPYGHVWVPRSLASDWRPYWHGRWVWIPLCGWTWLPYEPWGWAAYHYGRWHWGVGLGWYWIPTSLWGPGWVSWYWDYDYYYWAPLSYWGYPVVVVDNYFYGRYYGRTYPYNSRALTVIRKDQLKAKNVSKVALSQDSVKNLGKISLSSPTLGVKPTASTVSVESIEGKKVLLRKEEGPVRTAPESQTGKTSLRNPSPISPITEKGESVQKTVSLEERKIRKKEGPSTEGAMEYKGTLQRESIGYPSSPDISIRKNAEKTRSIRPSSSIDRFYKYFSERSSSRSVSSQGTISRGSAARSGSGSESGGRSSSSSSSSSRSSGSSKSGSVKKKN